MVLETFSNAKLIDSLETNVFLEKVYSNSLVELILKDGQSFDVEHMLQAKSFSTNILKDKQVALLVSFEGTFFPTKEARELLADPKYATHQKAIAVISENTSIKFLGELYLKVNKPKTPTKFLKSRAQALEWLKQFV